MKYTHFSRIERFDLSILLKKGHSLRQIATALGRDHSSVIREVKKNSVYSGIYKYLYTVYGQHLCQYLQYKRYKPEKRRESKTAKEIIKDRVFIDERPDIIN